MSHDNPQGLRKTLGNLMYQTRKPDETLVLVSGVSSHALAEMAEEFPHARFLAREDRADWGHEKRAEGLSLAGSEYVGWFNDDDSYALTYVEKMLDAIDGFDVAYCRWNSIPNCGFRLCSSTSGNFIVRTSLAQAVGYPTARDDEGRLRYESDGMFINALSRAGMVAPRVDEILYFHNHQP